MLKLLKNWTLLCALVIGGCVYMLFSRIPLLEPVGDACGPLLVDMLPCVIFVMLYLTFVKINMAEFHPRRWHFILQAIRVSLTALTVLAIQFAPTPTAKLILEGCFICFICPTAAAAAVVTEKLGGSIASMTVYMIIANCVTVIILPTFFPMVERGAGITFMMAFMMVLRRVFVVLLIPLILALLTRKFLPRVADYFKNLHNLAFYLWAFNLSILMGVTIRIVLQAQVAPLVMAVLIILPLFICLLQFAIGKWVGHFYGESIDAGQALGQKNNVVGVWLTLTFLNPLAVITPCAYIVWQNIVNALELREKAKYGRLRF